MGIVSIIGALLKVAGILADWMKERGLMTAAAKAAIADAVIGLNRRLTVGLAISREVRTPEQDLEELRKGGGA